MSIEDVIKGNGNNGSNGQGLNYFSMDPYEIIPPGSNGNRYKALLEENVRSTRDKYNAQLANLEEAANVEPKLLREEIKGMYHRMPKHTYYKVLGEALETISSSDLDMATEGLFHILAMLVKESPLSDKEKDRIRDKYLGFYKHADEILSRPREKRPVEKAAEELITKEPEASQYIH